MMCKRLLRFAKSKTRERDVSDAAQHNEARVEGAVDSVIVLRI